MRPLVPFLLALLGCSETSLNPTLDLLQPPNPPDLSVPTRIDRTVQVTIPSIDVLWVIDDSCSMESHQTELANSFSAFMDYFLGSGLDYHIGVVSTGWDDANARGKLKESSGYKWLDPTTPDPLQVFRGMAQLGTSGPSVERGRAQVYGAVELLGERVNAGFYREDAALAVVVISDEEDQSGSTPIGLYPFIDWLQALKPEPGMVTFSSIVGPDRGCQAAAPGREYLAVTREVGGIEWSICDGRWATVLEELGIQAAGLKREFYLGEVPVEDTIEVWVVEDGDRRDFDLSEWTYSRPRNSVTFTSFVPAPLSEVFVSYKPLAASQQSEDEAVDDR
jgi:hypothetical protein